GICAYSGHSHKHFSADASGYLNQIVGITNYSAVTGACLMCKRLDFEAIGGFDESLRSLEDIDYCWRIQQAGGKLHYEPDALLHFRYRNNISALARRNWLFGIYDVLLYQKHRPYGMPKLLTWKTFVKCAIVLPCQFLRTVRDKA
ncbi:glycosyltransferase, partial [Corallococcus praedator]|uniref:glycosyltransferase n=1 Tax=Corallococcus praedator TaxID=2316724 RepID=UPI001ABFC480